jgi:hypothetical protein
MNKKFTLLTGALTLLIACNSWAQNNPRIITAHIVQISDDQVVVRLRANNEEKTLEVSPATVKVTFKHDGESTEGTFADLRERMFCNIRLDTPDGVNALGFVVNGRKPDDSVTPSDPAPAPEPPQTQE